MKKIIISTLVVVVILGGIGLRLYFNTEEAANLVATEKVAIPFSIEAAEAKEIQFKDSSTYLGEILPFSITTISSETQGKISSVHFKKGDKVSKNQVLARLDQTILAATVAIQRATVEKLKKDTERMKLLLEENNASKQEWENLQIQLLTAEQQLKISEKELSHTLITSPTHAVVVEKFIHEGEIVPSGGQIATLADVSSVLARFYLNESDALRLKRGSKLPLMVKSYPGKTIMGEIESILPVANEAKLYPTEIKIINNNERYPLLAGMQISLALRFDLPKAMVCIPRTSVVDNFAAPSVFKIQKGYIQKVPITIEKAQGNVIGVSIGLQVGDTVVTLGLSNLEQGMKSPKFHLVNY